MPARPIEIEHLAEYCGAARGAGETYDIAASKLPAFLENAGSDLRLVARLARIPIP